MLPMKNNNNFKTEVSIIVNDSEKDDDKNKTQTICLKSL